MHGVIRTVLKRGVLTHSVQRSSINQSSSLAKTTSVVSNGSVCTLSNPLSILAARCLSTSSYSESVSTNDTNSLNTTTVIATTATTTAATTKDDTVVKDTANADASVTQQPPQEKTSKDEDVVAEILESIELEQDPTTQQDTTTATADASVTQHPPQEKTSKDEDVVAEISESIELEQDPTTRQDTTTTTTDDSTAAEKTFEQRQKSSAQLLEEEIVANSTKTARVHKGRKQERSVNITGNLSDPEAVKPFLEFIFSDLYISSMSTIFSGKSTYESIAVESLVTSGPFRGVGITAAQIMEAAKISDHFVVNEEHGTLKRLDPVINISDETAHLVDWTAYFKGITKSEDMCEALRIYFQLDTLPNQSVLADALHKCADLGDIDTASNIIQAIEMREEKPFPSVLLALAAAYATAGDNFQKCYHTLETVISKGVKPNLDIWMKLINAVGKTGDFNLAVELLEYMKKTGVKPDSGTYYTLMRTCGLTDPQHIKLLLDDMHASNIYDTVTYKYVLKTYANNEHLDEAKRLMKEMKDKNVDIGVGSYEIYLEHVCLSGDMEQSLSVLKDIDDAGVTRTSKMYGSMLEVCNIAYDIDTMNNFYNDMIKLGMKLSYRNYLCLLDTSRKCNLQQAEQIFQLMKDDKAIYKKMTISPYNLMMFGYAKKADYASTLAVTEEIKERKDIELTEASHAALIYAKGMSKGIRAGVELTQKFVNELDLTINNNVMNILLNVCSVQAELRVAIDFFTSNFDSSMSTNDTSSVSGGSLFSPDKVTYGTILKACARLEDIEKMFEIVDIMFETGIQLGGVHITYLLNAASKSGNTDQIGRVYKIMEKAGLTDADVVFVTSKSQTKKGAKPRDNDV